MSVRGRISPEGGIYTNDAGSQVHVVGSILIRGEDYRRATDFGWLATNPFDLRIGVPMPEVIEVERNLATALKYSPRLAIIARQIREAGRPASEGG